MKFAAVTLLTLQFALSNALTIPIPSIPFFNDCDDEKTSTQASTYTHSNHTHTYSHHGDSHHNYSASINSTSGAASTSVAVSTSAAAAISAAPVPASSSDSSSASSSASSSSSATAEASSSAQTFTGRGTFYEPSDDACGTSSTAEDMIVAISQQLYESNNLSNEYASGYCGKYINASYQGKSVKVKVVDACASCTPEDLDFSPAAFQQLADPDIGVIQVTWSWD